MPRLTSFAIAITAVFTLYMSNAARADEGLSVLLSPVLTATSSHAEFEWSDYDPDMFEHDMNDAWLGMPVVGPNGTKVGTVIDAVMNDKGIVEQVLVGNAALTSDQKAMDKADAEALVFEGRRVELRADYVALLPLENQIVADNR